MCDDNGRTFITSLYNVLLAPDLCDRLFSIFKLMNAGNTKDFHGVIQIIKEKCGNITTNCT